MADKDGILEAKNYGIGIEQNSDGFYVKGAGHYSWGMKSRLSKVFNPVSGKSLMLAFDHGYFLGPTSGLERLDLNIPPLAEYIDCFMGTRGGMTTCINPTLTGNKAIALRVTSGSSILDDDLSDEIISVDIAEAIRMNADLMASQVFIGAPNQRKSIENLSKVINTGNTYGVPTMGVVAVGKDMERNAKYFRLATRIIAEVGAQVVKCYYCDDFESVIAACPVPIVIAGGKKIPEAEALEMCYNAISMGAAGVDMGRNIFQSEDPSAMVQAVRAIVHEGIDHKEALDMFNALKAKK
ncbi:3-hydroxy-5-phosphonooxypentane-2,4-dione thiolase [Fusibacter ferrireducens]|uniref:3-hydroxy-5-phosphonooxypentane-2,4-dione thiolase n=1 Tax=Fusibacter ferrireducens TaxID=2785058 RepID=A0ABR9ZTV5_9FIRM|nr:3-hydroxy-5-phosphonooxypentane-2,4-dione thiolase [Fusibacter ferrireducens]MBF4693315.1 3-hydroxy-5-phosphonooxypentane-2,4-dione thiolase [Fusibacter ferrireducens]